MIRLLNRPLRLALDVAWDARAERDRALYGAPAWAPHSDTYVMIPDPPPPPRG